MRKRWQGHDAVFGRHGRGHAGLDFGNDDHVQDIQSGQHDAREKCPGVQLDHRHASRRAIDDQHDRGRNQNTQTTACGDGTCRQLNAVTGPQHGRQRQQAHERDHRAHDACGRGKNSAGHDGGHRQRTRHTGHGQVHALEELFNQVGAFNQVAHEHEQGDRDQHVVRHDREGALNHQVERLLNRQIGVGASVSNPGEDHAHAHEGERCGKTQHDRDHHQGQHQQSQMTVGHLGRRRQQNKGRQHDQGHDRQAKPDFFFHFCVPLAVTNSPSLTMSSSFTLTICLSFSTSTSSTSSPRLGHSPCLMHTMHRTISTKP